LFAFPGIRLRAKLGYDIGLLLQGLSCLFSAAIEEPFFFPSQLMFRLDQAILWSHWHMLFFTNHSRP
jgi:hypothetical protein